MKPAKAIGLIVVALAVVGIAFWFLSGGLNDSRGRKTDIAADVVKQSLERPLKNFLKDIGRYPSTDEGLAALSVSPPIIQLKWKGPYALPTATLLDPWRREYRYIMPGIHNPVGYDLWSLGPDGIESGDDIGNW
jgi:general secretion pathway protein G